jgi:spermidine/putrescine transport system permease protein
MNRPSTWHRWLTGMASGTLYLFLYAPLAVVIVFSFNRAKFGAGWKGFTTDWYRALIENEAVLAAAKNTLLLGALSTLIATTQGTMLGLGLSRQTFPGRRLFGWLMYVPVVIPDIVMAVALLMFYALAREWLGIFELGMTTMILAHVTFQIPFVAMVVRARLAGLDPALEEAARDLGASAWQVFWHVTLPLLWPGLLAGAMLAFTLSLDDFVVSFFTTGPGAGTLPILIYSSVKRGITPDINALSAILILISVLATVAITMLQRPPRKYGAANPDHP